MAAPLRTTIILFVQPYFVVNRLPGHILYLQRPVAGKRNTTPNIPRFSKHFNMQPGKLYKILFNLLNGAVGCNVDGHRAFYNGKIFDLVVGQNVFVPAVLRFLFTNSKLNIEVRVRAVKHFLYVCKSSFVVYYYFICVVKHTWHTVSTWHLVNNYQRNRRITQMYWHGSTICTMVIRRS